MKIELSIVGGCMNLDIWINNRCPAIYVDGQIAFYIYREKDKKF